ncbi:MAG: hypothetical protein K2W80_05380 [Burkholderiales bacterium]|nr:hypothetical protein [Burkholderiales bacterium]
MLLKNAQLEKMAAPISRMSEVDRHGPSLPESLAMLTGAIGAISLTASLVYDWGFFSGLDISFLDVPTTFGDHARSALLWFPKFVTAGLGILAFELLTQRIEGGLSDEELIARSSNPRRTRILRNSAFLGLVAVMFLSVLGFILLGESFAPVLPAAFLVMWIVFARWAQAPAAIVERRSRAVRLAITFLPALIGYLYFTGRNDAGVLYRSEGKATIVNAGGPPKKVAILRQLDRGVLIRDVSGTMTFLQWSEVTSMQDLGKFMPSRGLLCKFSTRLCPVPIAPSSP